jgi:hypothetical protein
VVLVDVCPGVDRRARLHYRFVPPLIHCTPDSLIYSVPLFLKRQCDRTLGGRPPALHRGARRTVRRPRVRPAAGSKAMIVTPINAIAQLLPSCQCY